MLNSEPVLYSLSEENFLDKEKFLNTIGYKDFLNK